MLPTLNDAGVVAFTAKRTDRPKRDAYLWEKGTITPLLQIGTDVPGAGKVTAVWNAWVNNKNRNVLLLARVGGNNGLYLFANGKLSPVALRGQEMPGGGTFRTLDLITPSYANEAGQHAFLAQLSEGGSSRTAAHLDGCRR